MEISLTPVESDGTPRGFAGGLPDSAEEVLKATAALYGSEGFEEPWVGYLALSGSVAVGACGFKSPPVENRVEIAYFTLPAYEGRGIATAMATRLVDIAWKCRPEVVVAAQTLPEVGASTRILEKLAFRRIGTVVHPEDGEVWEWQLERPVSSKGVAAAGEPEGASRGADHEPGFGQ